MKGVVFIIKVNNRYLLQQRDENSKLYKLTWVFPGGSSDRGETAIDTCIREVKEEFDINISPESCSLIGSYKIPKINQDNQIFLCNLEEIPDINLKEGKDFDWKTLEQLENINLGYMQNDYVLPILRSIVIN